MAITGSSEILKEDKIFFAEGQLDDRAVAALTVIAENLGAEIVTSPEDATVILTNPGSPHYRPITSGEASTSVPKVPYHWLSVCRVNGRRVAPAELDPPVPYMQHKELKAGNPLFVYVSKNVLRDPDKLDVDMWRVVSDELSTIGAIIVTKRAEADILVVDQKSDFYQNTIKPEIKRHKRHHQRIAERSWVEQCVAQRKYLDLVAEDPDRDEREDSFAEEEAVEKPKTGRPIGKPRVEYTPQDDDFLCRYLAAFRPGGSWGSRKTYEILASQANEFPLAERHSAQSWHERFKKNVSPFERRVKRYIDEGINMKLLTREEVKREREKTQRRAADEASQADEPTSSPQFKGKGKAMALPPKRKLVDLEANSDQEAQSPKDKERKRGVGSVIGRTDRIEALRQAASVERSRPERVQEGSSAQDPPHVQPALQSNVEPSDDPVKDNGVGPAPSPPPAAPVSIIVEETTIVETETEVRAAEVPLDRAPTPGAPPSPRLPRAPPQPSPLVSRLDTEVAPPSSTNATPTQRTVPSTQEAPPAQRHRTPETTATPGPNTPTPRTPQSLSPKSIMKRPRATEPVRPLHSPDTSARRRSASDIARKPADKRTMADEIALAEQRRQEKLHEQKRRRAVVTNSSTGVSVKMTPPATSALRAPLPITKATPQPAPLSPAEHSRRVQEGHQQVESVAETYRRRIEEYSNKYSLSTKELIRVVGEIKKGSAGGVEFWADLDAGLRARFGF